MCGSCFGVHVRTCDYTALGYNLDLPWVMSFHLVPLLPRLVAWKQRTTASDRHYKNLYIEVDVIYCKATQALVQCQRYALKLMFQLLLLCCVNTVKVKYVQSTLHLSKFSLPV